MGQKNKERILYFISKKLNQPFYPPRNITLTLNYLCNQCCIMCSIKDLPFDKRHEIRVEEIKKIIDEMAIMRIPDLVLTGGEPFLYEGIFEVIGYAKQKSRKVGNNLSFEMAIRGIKILADLRQRHNLKYAIGIGTVILKANIPELYDLFIEADKLGVDTMDFLPYLPDNTDFSNTGATSLWPDENSVGSFLQLYAKIARADAGHIRINSFIDARLTAKYYTRRMRRNDWQCLAGFKNIFITMSDPKRQGRLEPCVFMCKAHIPVRDHNYDLKKIWHSAQARAARRDIKRCGVYCYQPCFSLRRP